MSRRFYACLGVTALAVAALLSAAEPASAQRWGRGRSYGGYGYGTPYYGYNRGNSPMYSSEWGYGWGNRPWYSGEWGYGQAYYPGYAGSWSNAPQYSGPSATYYGEGTTEDYYTTPSGTSSGYQGQWYGAPSAGMNNQALINLRVPPNAEVYFDDQKTTQTGTFRSFISPPLNPNQDYVYHVRVHWMQDGRAVDKTRRIDVHAGDHLFVNLMSPGSQDSGAMPSRQYGTSGQQTGESQRDQSGTSERPATGGATNPPPASPSSDRPETGRTSPPENP